MTLAVRTTTTKARTPCGTAYVTIGEREGAPPLVSVLVGKAGGCLRLHVDVTTGLVDVALARGASLEELAEAMDGHGCHQSTPTAPSCTSAIAAVLREHAANQAPATSEPTPNGGTP